MGLNLSQIGMSQVKGNKITLCLDDPIRAWVFTPLTIQFTSLFRYILSVDACPCACLLRLASISKHVNPLSSVSSYSSDVATKLSRLYNELV